MTAYFKDNHIFEIQPYTIKATGEKIIPELRGIFQLVPKNETIRC